MTRTTIDRGWLHWGHGEDESDRPHVLLECPDGVAPASAAHQLADAGCDVTVCSGPDSTQACPLLEYGTCALVEQADVVINCLAGVVRENDELVDLIREVRPSVPLVVASPTNVPSSAFQILGRPPLVVSEGESPRPHV